MSQQVTVIMLSESPLKEIVLPKIAAGMEW
jgi:hypothetical protein